MKKNLMKLIAAILALAMVLSFAACKNDKQDEEESSESTPYNGEVINDDDVNATLPEDESSSDGETGSAVDSTEKNNSGSSTGNPQSGNNSTTYKPNVYAGFNSTNVSRVVAYYKAAAANTKSIDAKQYMTLKRIDFVPKNTFEEAALSIFKGIASAALKANSIDVPKVPGDHQSIQPSDITSANAVVDGKYTVVTLNVKGQTDDQYTKSNITGPVGHTVGTVGNITAVFDALSGITVDYSKGTILLKYENCKVVVKIDNTTGKIVSGTWGYVVDASIDNIYASFAGQQVCVSNTGGAVEFVVKTNDNK